MGRAVRITRTTTDNTDHATQGAIMTTQHTATDAHGHTITVGAWVRAAGMRKIEWLPVLDITSEGRLIVDEDLYGVRADCTIVAEFDASWGLDSASRNVPENTLCGWCDSPAAVAVTIPTMSHVDHACAAHFARYYPYLNNPQGWSALCPRVSEGCDHTMAQDDQGYGVACVEWADAHGIQWRQQ